MVSALTSTNDNTPRGVFWSFLFTILWHLPSKPEAREQPWKMFSCVSVGSKLVIVRSGRIEMALGSRWKFFNKELGKLRDALAKARDNQRSCENLGNEIMQARMWFDAIGQGKKSFNHQQC
ncbi:unnamed protein product [Prunus armeniaca]